MGKQRISGKTRKKDFKMARNDQQDDLPVEVETQEEYDLRKVLEENSFAVQDTMLEREREQIQSLYDLAHQVLMEEIGPLDSKKAPTEDGKPIRLGTNAAAQAGKKRNMMFISTQTSNLINIRKLMMDLVTQRTNLQRDTLDRNIKILAQMSKDKKGGSEDYAKIITFLINEAKISLPHFAGGHTIPTHSSVDDLLEERIQSDEEFVELQPDDVRRVEEESESEIPEHDADGFRIVYSQDDEKFYLVDANYEVQGELSEEDVNPQETEDGTIYSASRNVIIEIA
jgi:hypothetical protein